jgi:hypothetical protein
MAALQTTTELARVRYWQGQLLASQDLQTQLKVDEELRRLHNRAVHGAYGIAIGLTPTLNAGSIKLTCGMAYDCAGRGLIVETDRAIPLPAEVTRSMTLTIAYDSTSVHGISLTWKPTQQLNPNLEVAITRLISNAGAVEIDPQFRPVVARPIARPLLATGTTVPGETAWQPWSVGGSDIGVQVVVNTADAGYTHTPHYLAEAVPGRPTPDFVPAWFASIADPTPENFTLRLLLRRITRESLDIADPKTQVSAAPTLDRKIALAQANRFNKGDHVARLLPLAERLSIITALRSNGATLDTVLNDFTGTKAVAFGNLPRVAIVGNTPAAGSLDVQVSNVDCFRVHDLVAKISQGGSASPPVLVEKITKSTKTLTLSAAIAGLAEKDTIGAADFRVRATVFGVLDKTVQVPDASLFPKDAFIAHIDDTLRASAPQE